MKKERFYIASEIYHHEQLIEPWEQYDSSGKIDHEIVVSQRKVLIYSVTDENGVTRYYRYPSKEEVTETIFESSYSTESSSTENLYCWYIAGAPIPFSNLRERFNERYRQNTSLVGYFVPIEEFLNLPFDVTSPFVASTLLKLINVNRKGYVVLSMDPAEAKKQIEEIMRRKDSQEKKLSLH